MIHRLNHIFTSLSFKISAFLPTNLCGPETHNLTEVWTQLKNGVNAAGSIPSDWNQILTKQHLEEAGGWSPDSCQKRLQTFCNTEKVSCEIVNSSMGPDHAKIQIAELKITLKKYGKEFYAKEQARTKKCANNLVCWSIVKAPFLMK